MHLLEPRIEVEGRSWATSPLGQEWGRSLGDDLRVGRLLLVVLIAICEWIIPLAMASDPRGQATGVVEIVGDGPLVL